MAHQRAGGDPCHGDHIFDIGDMVDIAGIIKKAEVVDYVDIVDNVNIVIVVDLVDLDTTTVDIFVDNKGEAGRAWGVERGWLPDNKDVNPFLKLFGMLWGLGKC